MSLSPPPVNRADLDRYFAIEAERKSLSRQSSDLKKEADAIEEKILAFVRATGGKLRSVLRCGYRLTIKLAKAGVSWKPHFIRVASIEEAEQIIAAQADREELTIEKV